MKKKEQLFHLIKSLTTEEKRHFRLFTQKYQRDSGNNYHKLFLAIEKQTIYDERAIKEQFKNEVFVKQLTATKYYLQKQILKSLHMLHYDSTIDQKVLILHQQAAILFKKGQYETCKTIVEKGVEICSKNDRFLEWIGFLKWKLALTPYLRNANPQPHVHDYLIKISQLIHWFEITEKGTQLRTMIDLRFQDGYLFGNRKNNPEYHAIISTIKELLTNSSLELLPVKAKFNLYYPLASAYLALTDFKRAYQYFLILKELLQDTFIEKELFEEYIRTLSGLIYAAGGIGKKTEVISAVELLHKLPEPNEHIGFLKDEILSFFPLVNCALVGDLIDGLAAIKKAEKFIEKYKDSISAHSRFFTYFYAGYINLAKADFSAAHHYLRTADGFIIKDLPAETKVIIQIMLIIVYFEQNKYQLVQSRIRSLQRLIKKENVEKLYVTMFIRYFRFLISYAPPDKQQFQIMKRFLVQLDTLKASERMEMFLQFDLISWLQGRVQNRPFHKMLRKNRKIVFDGTENEISIRNN